MSRELKDAVAQLAGTFNRDFVSITACTVQSNDPLNRQCTCLPLNGSSEAVITVNLSAEPNDGILVTPTAGSTVLVAQTVQNDPFVLMFSDVEGFSIITADGATQFIVSSAGLIQLNDGSFGGLIKIEELVTKINAIENLLNGLITLYNAHVHSGGTISGSTGAPAVTEIGSIAPITARADIENTLITHGK